MQPKQSKQFALSALFIAVALSSVLLARWLRPEPPPTKPPSGQTPQQAVPTPSPPQANLPEADPLQAAQETAARLQQANDPEGGRQTLAALRNQLDNLPPQEASRLIQNLLDSKNDTPTHLPFKVGPDGSLASAPSLRVFLLDYLAKVDPQAAAAHARKILTDQGSPDEWAVALRNYAQVRSSPADRAFLEERLQTMLLHEPWQQNPSAGFLEAFDVAVYLGGSNLVSPLTSLVRKKDNQAVAHAAYLALDRLTIADPLTTLSRLQSDPDLMAGREVTRANYFARADVGNPEQRLLVERYLLNSELSPAELATFAGLFPNANYMISHNLLTRTPTPNHATLARQDQAALSVVQGWLADPRFQPLKPQLQKIKSRLESFVSQAAGK